MPELPEVETIVRSLAPRLKGRRIINAEFLAPRIIRHWKDASPEMLEGRVIRKVHRHGKHILITLDRGLLIVHLGMTGKLLLESERTAYTRAIFTLSDGTLNYDDTRMFGSIEWSEELPERMHRLGPEPLEVSPAEFYTELHRHKAPIKALLMNQGLIRGIGNIYTDEALFRSRIHPATKADRLSRARASRLHAAVVEVLSEAIEHRGSSVSDYVDTEGRKGGFQLRHHVYGREGKPCVRCGTAIKRIVLAQRGTHFCPKCQR